MENVLLGVAVALFIIGAALAVVAGVMFVKRDVMDSVRFLQGKRMAQPAGAAKKSSRTGMLRQGRQGRRGGGARAGRPAGDDRATDVPGTGPGEDSPTAVVAAGQERGDDRPTTISGKAVASPSGKDAFSDGGAPRYEESEFPTEILSERDDSEQPTGVLAASDEGTEDSERPTGVLGPEEQAEDSERPTGVLTEDGAGEDESERPTGVLADEALGEVEDSERPTGVLAEDEAAEDAERSECPTVLLGDEPSEAATGVLVGEVAALDDSGSTSETTAPESVAQQDESLFRFILKQDVLVVHTEETLDEH
ncbi:hypothetical protein H6A08_06365 [Enorma massiliensis]|uniref:hypothetical protein n=1 Tax=Enorma massiliensis TaxID=1472761 RepID=UPI00195884F1|nr:hypothetical protein [Enorma massiliensis]MBM6783982.1 hypothetical protein [Enorma massiliensis]